MDPGSSTKCNQYGYDHFPEDKSTAAHGSSVQCTNLPEYCYEHFLGISDEINERITGSAPCCYLDSCEKVYLLIDTARRHRSKLTLLPSTIEAIKNAFSTHQQLRVAGIVSLPFAIVHDVVAPPYHLTQMAIAVSWSRYERRKADTGILHEIRESLWLSFDAVVKMVTRLGLENNEAMKLQIQNGEGYVYLTLARLLEAYGSRFAPSGTVFLSSHKKLLKEHCSGTARLHFEQIHYLKESLRSVDLFPAQSLPGASAVLESWLRRIFPALKESSVDFSEDNRLSHIIQTLRHIQHDMPELMLLETKN